MLRISIFHHEALRADVCIDQNNRLPTDGLKTSVYQTSLNYETKDRPWQKK